MRSFGHVLVNNTTIVFAEVIGIGFMLKFAILVATSSTNLGVTSADALGQDRPTNRAVGSEPTFGFFVAGAFAGGMGSFPSPPPLFSLPFTFEDPPVEGAL